jgi:hypothetical protein
LFALIVLMAIGTWLVPAGIHDRDAEVSRSTPKSPGTDDAGVLGQPHYQLGDVPSVALLAGDRPPSTELGMRSEAGGDGGDAWVPGRPYQ